MTDNDIDYIARHYRRGLFDADCALRRLGIAAVPLWRRFHVAAAVAALVVLSAAAAIIYNVYIPADVTAAGVSAVPENPMAEVKVMDFENATLTDVTDAIEAVYGVKVENLPDNPGDYTLSLHYEGTPADLVSVINDILGTELTVTEQ